MNNKTKTIVKTLITGLACVALCGTTIAAPRGGGQHPKKAPVHQKAPAPKVAHGHDRHGGHVVHHAPAPRPVPPPPRPAPPPPPPCHDHHAEAGIIALGAAVVGGIIGGIAGACN